MLLILATLLAQQQATVEDVLKLMEQNTSSLRDLTFDVTTGGTGTPFADSNAVTVTWRRDSGLRLRMVPKRKAAGAAPMPFRAGGMEVAYTRDALHIWISSELEGNPLAVTNLRMAWADPAAKSFDPYFLPSGFPVRFFVDDPFLYYELDPRLFFGIEPNLACEGKRTEDGKAVHVLSSYLAPSALAEKLHGSEFVFSASRKEFHVDAASGQLVRVRWEVAVKQSMGGRDREEKVTFVATGGARTQVADGVTLPSGSTWQVIEARRGARNDELTHSFKNWRANTGLGADAILSDSERADLYADAVLLKAEEYDAAVKKNDKDAAARYSAALARGTPSIMEQMMGAPPREKPKIADALAKVMELAPGAEGPVLNFIAAAEAEGAPEKAQAVVAKIADGTIKGDRVRTVAAARLNAKGEYDLVLKLLEKAPAAESLRRRAAVERMFALVARKDGAAAVAAMRDEAGKRAATADKVALVKELESRFASLPKDAPALEALLEESLAKSPELALSLEVARRRATPEAAAALVETAPADVAAVDFAIELVEAMTAFTKEGATRLREALAKSTTGDPRAPFQAGRALKIAGLAEEAKKEFAAALERCATVPKGHAAGGYAAATLYELAQEDESNAWLERVVKELVRVAPSGEGLPAEAIWNEQKNPVLKLARKHVAAKRWLEFWRLASQAGERLMMRWQMREGFDAESQKACAAAVREELLRGAKDAEPHRKYAAFAEQYLNDEGTLEVLEAARALAPKDVAVVWMTAEAAQRRGENDRAIAAYEAAASMIESSVDVNGRRVTRASALLALARLHGSPEKVKEALAKIDLKAADADADVAEDVGDEYAKRDEWDAAIAAWLRAKELGRRPYFKLGRAHEKKGDRYEALRWYNRDIALGSSRELDEPPAPQVAEPVPVEPGDPAKPPPEREPVNGKEARERLIKKHGTDWLIDKFLEGKFEPLTADEQSRVARAVEHFRSEELGERESAEAEVRKIGVRAGPSLRDLLRAGDEEVKTRVRAILSEWAEPR
jgi:hypothetical protein